MTTTIIPAAHLDKSSFIFNPFTMDSTLSDPLKHPAWP